MPFARFAPFSAYETVGDLLDSLSVLLEDCHFAGYQLVRLAVQIAIGAEGPPTSVAWLTTRGHKIPWLTAAKNILVDSVYRVRSTLSHSFRFGIFSLNRSRGWKRPRRFARTGENLENQNEWPRALRTGYTESTEKIPVGCEPRDVRARVVSHATDVGKP